VSSTPNAETVRTTNGESRPGGSWAAYAACVLALLHAAVSFYWAGGGTAGLSTIGGTLEELGRAREPALIALMWFTGLLKVAAGLLALALVRPWGRAFPRRMLLAAAWGGAALLIVYGGLLTLGGVLVVASVIPAPAAADWTALRWHAFFWDPWFLLWGILLAAAAHRTKRSIGMTQLHETVETADHGPQTREDPLNQTRTT
jgi:Protein of unknown function (DUF3995)